MSLPLRSNWTSIICGPFFTRHDIISWPDKTWIDLARYLTASVIGQASCKRVGSLYNCPTCRVVTWGSKTFPRITTDMLGGTFLGIMGNSEFLWIAMKFLEDVVTTRLVLCPPHHAVLSIALPGPTDRPTLIPVTFLPNLFPRLFL